MGEKGKKKSRILLIVCGLLLLAGAVIGIVMFRMQAGASAYNESIKTAEKYAVHLGRRQRAHHPRAAI